MFTLNVIMEQVLGYFFPITAIIERLALYLLTEQII
jgi:hypothetical protein